MEIIILPLNNSVFCYVLIKIIFPFIQLTCCHALDSVLMCIFYFGWRIIIKWREKKCNSKVFSVYFRLGKIIRIALFLHIEHFSALLNFAPNMLRISILSFLFGCSGAFCCVLNFCLIPALSKISTLSIEMIV